MRRAQKLRFMLQRWPSLGIHDVTKRICETGGCVGSLIIKDGKEESKPVCVPEKNIRDAEA